MAIGDIVGIKTAGENFEMKLLINCGIGRHNGTIDNGFANGFMYPLNAIC